MNQKAKKIISYLVACAAIVIGAYWVYDRLWHPGNVEYTDNAQVYQQIVPVISRVQGYIKDIRFKEFEQVKKGDTLVIIDDADLRLQLSQAVADYKTALAALEVSKKTVNVTTAGTAVSEGAVEEAKILMENTEKDFFRYENLLAKGAVTRQQFDAIKTDMEAKKARYLTLISQKQATNTLVNESTSRIEQFEAAVDLAKSRMELAELNLSYCIILSPCDGYTSRKEITQGQLVQPGQNLLDLVNAEDIWVMANYKETQIKNISIGASVNIKIDAIPDVEYHGKVEAISEATGSKLSMFPQDNSSGNFVKVKQRIPVKIIFTGENPIADLEKLRAGMNAECEVKY